MGLWRCVLSGTSKPLVVCVGTTSRNYRGAGLANDRKTKKSIRLLDGAQRRAVVDPETQGDDGRRRLRSRSARGRTLRIHPRPIRDAGTARGGPRLRTAAPRPHLADLPRRADRAWHQRRVRRQCRAHRRCRRQPLGNGRPRVPPAQHPHAGRGRRRRRVGAIRRRRAEHVGALVDAHRAGAHRAHRAAAVPLLFRGRRPDHELLQGSGARDRCWRAGTADAIAAGTRAGVAPGAARRFGARGVRYPQADRSGARRHRHVFARPPAPRRQLVPARIRFAQRHGDCRLLRPHDGVACPQPQRRPYARAHAQRHLRPRLGLCRRRQTLATDVRDGRVGAQPHA